MSKQHDRSDRRSAPDDEPNRYTYEEASELDESAFNGGNINRRTFLSVAAATGAALSLPSTVSADVSDDRVTDLAEFAVNATPEDYEATLVVEFEDANSVASFCDRFGEPDWDIDESLRAPKTVAREEPTPAAHAYLTVDELDDALDDLDGIEHVDFSPGGNPFWKLDGPYADGVFPDVENARDWISHQEAGWALDHLEEEYSDMIRVHRIGQGPGHENRLTGEDPDRRDIYIAELTNDIQNDASFAEKDKAVFTIGIHGNERAGVEAGSRILENAAKGEANEFNPLLDDIVIVYVYINPDGWVVRKPHMGWDNEDDEIELSHARGNSTGLDTNRQYPTIGWANTSFWPAEPDATPDVRPGYDMGYEDMVPDALATVDHLRGYDNVEYLCDYHMMGWADQMVLNLESNAAYDHDGTHNLDEVNRRIGDSMNDFWGGPEAIADDTRRAGGDTTDEPEYVPETLFDYGSIYDTLGYNITGGLLGWAGQPEEFGGLGAITVAPELGMRDFADWRPYIERHLATAYHLSMREFGELAAMDTNATVATGEQDTAYVTTDALTRTSADLSHTDEGAGQGNGASQNDATNVQHHHEKVQFDSSGTAEVSSETHSLAVRCDLSGREEGVVTLVNPDGQVVRGIDAADNDATSFYIPNPDEGEWSIEFDGDGDIEIDCVTVETDEGHPDPEAAFGYSQTEYVVNPMQFFVDLAPHLEEGDMDGLRVRDVRNGRLMRGNSGMRHYDKLVVSHDVGCDDEQYVSEIEAFVEGGGDLVLTDRGLYLLDILEVGDAATLSRDDLESTEIDLVNLVDRNFDHYLLSDLREIQREIWKSPQIGYSPNEFDQPITIIDDDAFEAAGGDVAGRMQVDESGWDESPDITAEGVAAGSLSVGDAEINLIGSALPPAHQEYLHPFGMADYAVSFMGHTMLCNALGFEQRRFVEDELVGTWGGVR